MGGWGGGSKKWFSEIARLKKIVANIKKEEIMQEGVLDKNKSRENIKNENRSLVINLSFSDGIQIWFFQGLLKAVQLNNKIIIK